MDGPEGVAFVMKLIFFHQCVSGLRQYTALLLINVTLAENGSDTYPSLCPIFLKFYITLTFIMTF